jgi:uncharacterized protein YpmS
MKDNTQTTCEQNSSLTQVSTTYARICVILLALNFCLTGYVMTGMMKLQQEQNERTTTVPATSQTAGSPQITTTPATTAASTEVVDPPQEVNTLDK